MKDYMETLTNEIYQDVDGKRMVSSSFSDYYATPPAAASLLLHENSKLSKSSSLTIRSSTLASLSALSDLGLYTTC
uniref:Uncharacterized protein n=1 Tax=Glossina pallidipes TaxID=7398 RepID=A0A1B0A338_GLOPL